MNWDHSNVTYAVLEYADVVKMELNQFLPGSILGANKTKYPKFIVGKQ